MQIAWPERSRLIPERTESLRIEIYWVGDRTTLVDSRVVQRPAAAGTITETFSLKSGNSYGLAAIAFPEAAAGGTPLARGYRSGLTITPGSQAAWALSLGSSIRTLAVSPAISALHASQPQVASVTALDSEGQTVLLAPGRIEWTVSDPAIMKAEKDPSLQEGQVRLTGLKEGRAFLEVKDQESGVASAPVMVSVDTAVVQDICLDLEDHGPWTVGGMSADGSLMALMSFDDWGNPAPLMWDLHHGFESVFGSIFEGQFSIWSMSSDGGVVTGSRSSLDSHTGPMPFIWTPSTGFATFLMYDASYPIPARVSGDGKFVTGTRQKDSTSVAYRWSKETGIQDLGAIDGGSTYQIYAASTHGSTIVGSYVNQLGKTRAFIWTEEEGMRDLGTPGTTSIAKSVSGDGTAVAGIYWSGNEATGFRWSRSEGFIDIGRLDGQNPNVSAISADGTTIVGGCGPKAFRWTASLGMMDLGNLGGSASASCVSADGSVIAGTSAAPVQQQRIFRWEKGGQSSRASAFPSCPWQTSRP